MPEIKADVVDPGKLRKLAIVFFSRISYNREVLKIPAGASELDEKKMLVSATEML